MGPSRIAVTVEAGVGHVDVARARRPRRGQELTFTGRMVGGEEAVRIGSATRVADERSTIGSLIGRADQVEAVTAYFDKRPPVFEG